MTKVKYTTDAERIAAQREYNRRSKARIKADPERQERTREQKRASRERIAVMNALPKPVDSTLYRAHGPFATLFALQGSAIKEYLTTAATIKDSLLVGEVQP